MSRRLPKKYKRWLATPGHALPCGCQVFYNYSVEGDQPGRGRKTAAADTIHGPGDTIVCRCGRFWRAVARWAEIPADEARRLKAEEDKPTGGS